MGKVQIAKNFEVEYEIVPHAFEVKFYDDVLRFENYGEMKAFFEKYYEAMHYYPMAEDSNDGVNVVEELDCE